MVHCGRAEEQNWESGLEKWSRRSKIQPSTDPRMAERRARALIQGANGETLFKDDELELEIEDAFLISI